MGKEEEKRSLASCAGKSTWFALGHPRLAQCRHMCRYCAGLVRSSLGGNCLCLSRKVVVRGGSCIKGVENGIGPPNDQSLDELSGEESVRWFWECGLAAAPDAIPAVATLAFALDACSG